MTVDGVGERVAKVELARVHDAAADVHLDVDVHGASLVPAGIDRAEEGEALRVRALDAAHERPARRTRAETGVDAYSVRMPDVDGGVPDRPARRASTTKARRSSGVPGRPSVMLRRSFSPAM